MSVVNLQHKEQTGNWQAVLIATVEEINFMPDILTNANAATSRITAVTNTLDVLPVPEMARITSTKKRTSSGYVYNISCQVDFEYQSTLVDDFLESFKYKKVVVIAIKPWGMEKLFGSKLHPLKFDYQFLDGQKLVDGTKVRVLITGKIPQKPVIVKD